MNIIFNAVGYHFQDELKEHFGKRLNDYFSEFQFIQSAAIKISDQNNSKKVNLKLSLKKGPDLFATSQNAKEVKAFEQSFAKIKTQIETYKSKHFQSHHKN